jgi:hypothetical protein
MQYWNLSSINVGNQNKFPRAEGTWNFSPDNLNQWLKFLFQEMWSTRISLQEKCLIGISLQERCEHREYSLINLGICPPMMCFLEFFLNECVLNQNFYQVMSGSSLDQLTDTVARYEKYFFFKNKISVKK